MPADGINDWGNSVFLAISNALDTFISAIPAILGALLLLVIGWVLSGIAARIVSTLLQRAGADRMVAERGPEVYGQAATRFTPSQVAGEVVKWIIRLLFLVAAANLLGLTQISLLLNQIILWLPNLIVAAVILLVAPLLAKFVRGAIEVGAGRMGFTNAPLLGRVAEVAIIAFAVIIAINQIGIAGNLVQTLFNGVVFALAIAFGLAFGLGGQGVAADLTRQWYDSSRRTAQRVAESTQTADSTTQTQTTYQPQPRTLDTSPGPAGPR
jgi:hypothetical protein